MRTTTPTYILSICLEKESIFSKLCSSHYFQVRWAQITHDWMEQLWKTPDGGKLGSIFTNFFICLIISSPITSFVFNFHTIRPGARLLYQTEPLSGAATLVARLWLYPRFMLLCTTRVSQFLQEGRRLWPAHHVTKGVECLWQTRG